MVTIALDAMGSDRAPDPEIAGALRVHGQDIEVVLVGDEARLASSGLRVVHAPEAVTMDDHPAQVFRQKPGSSLRVALELVKAGDADAVVTAGNSGAALTHGVLVLGRSAGVERPAIVTVLPTPAGPLTLCDAGANVDVKATMLRQFALLGAAYDRVVHGREPRVGLLSNGGEPGKGTALTREAHELLEATALHYLGYVEGSDLFRGAVDVVVTDGFTGNIVLKTAEGLAAAMDAAHQYQHTGGALLAGVDGVLTIAHGRSDEVAIENAIRCAARFAGAQVPARLAEAVQVVGERGP